MATTTSYNPVTIEDFPETNTILSSDKIILFTEKNNQFVPMLVEISAFSELIVMKNGLSALEERVSQLESKFKETARELSNTYMTPEQVIAEYSILSDFNNQISKLKKIEDFKSDLSKKADITYLDSRYNSLKAKCQNMKKYLGCFSEGDGKGYKLLMAGKAIEGPSE